MCRIYTCFPYICSTLRFLPNPISNGTHCHTVGLALWSRYPAFVHPGVPALHILVYFHATLRLKRKSYYNAPHSSTAALFICLTAPLLYWPTSLPHCLTILVPLFITTLSQCFTGPQPRCLTFPLSQTLFIATPPYCFTGPQPHCLSVPLS